jgi:HlyD family secretion protein
VAALAILAWGFVPAPVEVDLGRIGRGSLAVTVDHEGKTRVKDRFVISSPLAGRLLRIGRHADRQDGSDATLRAGDRVEKDKTLLAVIEPADPALLDARAHSQAQARRSAAEEGLNKAAADLERAQSLHKQAERQVERDQRSYRRQGVSQEDLEKAEFGERAAAAALRSAEFAHGVARFELKQAVPLV